MKSKKQRQPAAWRTSGTPPWYVIVGTFILFLAAGVSCVLFYAAMGGG